MKMAEILPWLMLSVGIFLGFTIKRLKDLLIDNKKSVIGHLEPETTRKADEISDEEMLKINSLKKKSLYLMGVLAFLFISLIIIEILL